MNKDYSRPAVIFDLDGTLADITSRRALLQANPKDWNRFFSDMEFDLPNHPVIEIFKVLAQTNTYAMVVVTGRPERYRETSVRWLAKHGLAADFMFMRKDGDRREDHIIKEEILCQIKISGMEIKFAIDDRDSVVQMWRRNGVTCFQCDEGKF